MSVQCQRFGRKFGKNRLHWGRTIAKITVKRVNAMKFLCLLLTPLAVALLVVGVVAVQAGNQFQQPIPEQFQLPPSKGNALGMQSCAASACHGNAIAPSLTAAPDKNCWQSSLTHFFAVDPHRKAYDVLESEQSKRISDALRKYSSAEIPKAPNDLPITRLPNHLADCTNARLPYDF